MILTYLPHFQDYLADKPDTYLMVQNMAPQANAYDLYTMFSKYGKVVSYNMRYDPLERPAFFEVQFETPLEATKAQHELHRARYCDQTLYVKVSVSPSVLST